MKSLLESLTVFLIGDAQAERMVPPSGFTVRLVVIAAAAMGFLATVALAFTFATGQLADRWSTDLARTSTIRISAPEGQVAAQTQAVVNILQTTPGIASARVIGADEQRALLAPWFGPDLPIDSLPIPKLIEVVETADGMDLENMRLRLSSEAPGAVLDDHRRWRKPLVNAATKLRLLGWVALGLILGTLGVMITLAAQSALAANHQVIFVLRLIGARDHYIAQAFVRRFTLRTFWGAAVGIILGLIAVALMPSAAGETGFLTGLRFSGAAWLLPLWIPFLAAIVGFFATRKAATRVLKDLS